MNALRTMFIYLLCTGKQEFVWGEFEISFQKMCIILKEETVMQTVFRKVSELQS